MMMPMEIEEGQTDIKLYVVVSHKFHRALGPFSSATQAGGVAAGLTKNSKSGNVYVPVPLTTLGPVQMLSMDHSGHDHEKKGKDESYHPGQYL